MSIHLLSKTAFRKFPTFLRHVDHTAAGFDAADTHLFTSVQARAIPHSGQSRTSLCSFERDDTNYVVYPKDTAKSRPGDEIFTVF